MSGNVSKIEELGQCSELVGSVAKAMALVAPKMTVEARQSWIGLPPADFAHVLEQQVFLPSTNGDKLVSDSIVRVNRAVKPTCPGWMKGVLHPELEGTGPAEYNIANVEQWLHEGQKNGGCVKGQKIYKHLKNNNMLESCLGLADLLAIQAKGIDFFRKHFAGKAVFGWKSVVWTRIGYLNVPCLYESGGKVYLDWYWLGNGWYGDNPALRFAS